ncbi:MAG: Gfo/Idh/MocA family oxidoreductase [Ruminococcaceae bacterium]|nr:Gfo/Idh/MocA family oxidoreductase [Oscillospiraceae bacterium]
MKNVCIVGYGAIGPIHADAITKTQNANFYAVCDVEPFATQKCLQKHDVIVYNDFDEMLEDENIEFVHICTPHYLHFEMISKALKKGKTVVCEKPIVMTEQELEQLYLLDGCDKICAVFQNRVNPCVAKLKEICVDKTLGDIKAARGILTWFRDMDYYNSGEWRGKNSTEGGGVVINQAIHTLDYFSLLPEDVYSVSAVTTNFTLPEIEVEDTAIVNLKFKNGARGVFFATNGFSENSNPFFEVTFERGILRYIDNKLFLNGEVIEQDSNATVGKDYWGRGHEILFKDLYDNGKTITVLDAKQTMQTVFAIYKSAKNNGKEIVL